MKWIKSYLVLVIVIVFTNSIFAQDDGQLEFNGKIGTTLRDYEKSSSMLFNS